MRQVASEATTHAFKPALRNTARPAPSSERAHGSPFESLLDDGTQTTSSQPPQTPPAPADKPAAQVDSAQPPAKAKGAKAEQPGGNTKAATDDVDGGNAAETDTPVACKAPSDSKVKADAKICEEATAGDDSKAAGDGKPADAPLTTLAADPATGANQIITPAVAATPAPATVTPAAPDGIPQTAPTKLTQTLASTGQAAIVAAGTPKAKAVDPDKAADDSKSSTKPAFEPHGDGKLQSVTSDAEKPAAAHPRDEVPANTHRASIETSPPVLTDVQAAAPKMTGEIAQQASLPPQPQTVSPASANPTAPAPLAAQPAAVPLAGVAIEIAGMALAGKNHFEIRLDPPELGRIEVRLDVDRDGHVTSRLIADRSDTLDLLRRDASGLERALQDAGLKTADNGLQFSLRDQTMGREQSNTPTPTIAQIVVSDSALPPIDATQPNYSRLAGLRGGIDIRV